MTSDEKYVEDMFRSWEKIKDETRKKLPEIYNNSNEDVKIIIKMLVVAEHENAILQDNVIRRNCRERNEIATTDTNAKTYIEENKEICKLINY